MDDDGLRNWGYYEPFKEHLGLQLMSPMGDHRDTKPYFSSRENPLLLNPSGATYHHPHTRMVSEPTGHMNYMRDGWIQRERFHHMQPGPSYSALSNTTSSHNMHLVPALDMSKDHVMSMLEEDNAVGDDSGGGSGNGDEGGSSIKKRGSTSAPKTPRTKRPKKGSLTPKVNGKPPGHRAKTVKKNVDMVINGIDMDISGIPIPVCSCTESPQQCYRWGAGGWQSACCTTTISMYPLPMSTKRRGARIAGRKMSQGAFKKVLEKLASEGYNFANAIDLRSYWAKHGTNKFVTIR